VPPHDLHPVLGDAEVFGENLHEGSIGLTVDGALLHVDGERRGVLWRGSLHEGPFAAPRFDVHGDVHLSRLIVTNPIAERHSPFTLRS